MADWADEATEVADMHRDRAVAAARAAAPRLSPLTGTCGLCGDDLVPVLLVGRVLQCTPCREKLERRR